MSQDECLHGMAREGCGLCAGNVATAASIADADPPRIRSKQHLFDDLCDILGVARYTAVPGSSPARVFDAAAITAKVKPGSMPKVGAAIAAKAGLAWGPQCDNRRRHEEATMVTREGVAVVTEAMGILTKAMADRAAARTADRAAARTAARRVAPAADAKAKESPGKTTTPSP